MHTLKSFVKRSKAPLPVITDDVEQDGDGQNIATSSEEDEVTDQDADVEHTLPLQKLSKKGMHYLVTRRFIDGDWQDKLHTHLDFSDQGHFNLSSFRPDDFGFVGRPRKKVDASSVPPGAKTPAPQPGAVIEVEKGLHVWKVHTLDLSNNSLTDRCFSHKCSPSLGTTGLSGHLFTELKILRFARNKLECPAILLPKLKELTLSHNAITAVPPLVGLPSLELLNLSHNSISLIIEIDEKKRFCPFTGITMVDEDESAAPAKGLRNVDLSHNHLNMPPSMLDAACVELSRLLNFEVLTLRDNPFCSFFAEYQVLCVARIPSLTRIDDTSLVGSQSQHIRREMAEQTKNYFGIVFKQESLTGKAPTTFPSVEDVDNPKLNWRTEGVVDNMPKLNDEIRFREISRLVLKEYRVKLQVEGGDFKEAIAAASRYFRVNRLRQLDVIFQERQSRPDKEKEDEKKAEKSRKAIKGRTIPRIIDMIKEYDHAIEDPSVAIMSITLVLNLSRKIAGLQASQFEHIFEGRIPGSSMEKQQQSHKEGPQRAKNEVSATFVQQAMVLVERHPEERSSILRTLAKFSVVHEYRLGELCLGALARIAKNEGAAADVLHVIGEMVVPQLLEKSSVSDEGSMTIVVGLSNFESESLSEVLGPVMMQLFQSMKTVMHSSGNNSADSAQKEKEHLALIKLIGSAVQKYENALITSRDESTFPNFVRYLNEDVMSNEATAQLFCNTAEIVRSCMKHDPEYVISRLKGEHRLHKTIATKVSDFIKQAAESQAATRSSKDMMEGKMADKAAAIIDLLTDMMEHDEEVRHQLSMMPPADEGGPSTGARNVLMSIITEAPKKPPTMADPSLLGASLRCLKVVLADRELRNNNIQFVMTSMQLCTDNSTLLPNLSPKIFRDVYKTCEKKSLQGCETDSVADVPDFSGATNKLAHSVLIAVMRLVELFTAMGDECRWCQKISDSMNTQGRERLLMHLLQVPSEDVQDAVMSCISKVKLEELDDDEITVLIGMLNPSQTARQESLLIAVIEQFERLVSAEGERADQFRTNYSADMVKRVFAVLMKNAERRTYGNILEEEQKAALSLSCVSLLACVSSSKLLRVHLRWKDLQLDFRRILKNEEKFHNYYTKDVCIELTWTGRHVEYLISCLGSADCLNNKRKQAFRVFGRIADVIEGRSDGMDPKPPVDAVDRGKREGRMWSEHHMRRQVSPSFMDDATWEDRMQQQQGFVAFSGLERMIHFLEQPELPHAGIVSAGESEKPAQAATSAGEMALSDGASFRNMQHKKNAEMRRVRKMRLDGEAFFQQVNADAQALLTELVATSQAAKDRETPPEIQLAKPGGTSGLAGEKLLREVFMREGFVQRESHIDVKDDFKTTETPHKLRSDEIFFVPNTNGQVAPVYCVAAFLRAIFAILTVPGVERFRLETLCWMRQEATQLRLINLVECCETYVNCNLAAKFFRVMAMVLKIPADKASNFEPAYLVDLSVSAFFACSVFELLKPLIQRLGRGRTLTAEQQTLCMECTRMIAVIATAVPYINIMSSLDSCIANKDEEFNKQIQKACTEAILGKFLPMSVIYSVFLCLLYDMQMNIGSASGPYINEKYVRSTYDRQGIRELCSEVLVIVLQAMPDVRYEVLELFNHFEVFGKNEIRTSFLNGLLDKVHDRKYQLAMETILQAPHLAVQPWSFPERIIHTIHIELGHVGKEEHRRKTTNWQGLKPQILVLTNKRFLIMARPRHGPLSKKCGVCPPESFCPIGPSIEQVRHYADMTRIAKGPDQQSLLIGWQKMGANGTSAGEDFQNVICLMADSRRYVIDALTQMSGPGIEQRIRPTQDLLMRQALAKKSAPGIVRITYAMRLLASGMERLSLFVLGETELLEFDFLFEHWLPPCDIHEVLDHSDSEDEIHDMEDNNDLTNFEELDPALREKYEERMLRAYQTTSQEWLKPKGEESSSKALAVRDQDQNQKANARKVDATAEVQPGTLWFSHHDRERDLNMLRWTAKRVQEHFVCQDERASNKKDTKSAIGVFQALTSKSEADDETSTKNLLKQAMRKAKQVLLKQHEGGNHLLSELEKVELDSGEIPILRLHFRPHDAHSRRSPDDTISIRFFDDVARERWRRGLAFVLNKSDTAAQWHRDWSTPGPEETWASSLPGVHRS